MLEREGNVLGKTVLVPKRMEERRVVVAREGRRFQREQMEQAAEEKRRRTNDGNDAHRGKVRARLATVRLEAHSTAADGHRRIDLKLKIARATYYTVRHDGRERGVKYRKAEGTTATTTDHFSQRSAFALVSIEAST